MSFNRAKKNLKQANILANGRARHVYEFGSYRVDPTERQLLYQGSPVGLTAKTFDTLVLLVQRSGHLVEKHELMQAIWPDSFVEEGNLSVTIYMLRKVLNYHGCKDRYIETVAKRGYRFVGHVRRVLSDRELSSGRIPSSGLRSTDSKTRQLYLEGRFFWNKRTEDGLRRSIECFQRAVTEDSGYAAAYAGLADSFVLLDSYGVEPALRAYPLAKATALKALQLDDSLAEAHASLGMVYFYYEWNWSAADKEFKRAIALDQNYALARSWYALNLGAMGQYEEALDQVRRALELDPLSLEINTVVGRIFYLSRQYDQSIYAYRKVIDLDRHYARAHARLGMTYAAAEVFGDAIREFEESQRLSGSDPYIQGLTGYACAKSGNIAGAHELLGELNQRSRQQDVRAFGLALICIGLGKIEEAVAWLTKSYEDRSSYMAYAKTDPLLDPVRPNQQFAALLRQMGL
jgi:DNA-binding winged helix-turn-helix (wHTH) protein/tetratricopeptide (TPR) repeat protein